MSKRRHKKIESSEHHAPHAESSAHEHHEHKEHQEKAEEHSHVNGTKAGSKIMGSRMMVYAGSVLIAVVFFTIGSLVGSMGGGSSGAKTASDQLVFISPPGCSNCTEMEAVAKSVASTLKIPFVKTGFSQQMSNPGYVLVYNNSFLGAMGFDTEYTLKNQVCILTKNTDVCNQAQQLSPPVNNSQPAPSTEIPKAEKTNVKFFTMAYCPYGNQAESGIIPVYKLLKDKVEWEPHYVIYANYHGGGPDYCMGNGSYCSMHGIQELNEDIRELCIWKYETHDKFFNFLDDVNSACNAQNVDSCWEAVAKKYSINTDKIKQCQSDEGIALAKAEFELDQQYGVQGSPSVIINDGQYQGGRAPEDFKTAICSGFNSPPSECSQSLGSGTTAASGGCGT